ncbi:MAG: choice-of-anchor Q domain-containing protein, partial [Planctomycetota bacterium]
MSLATRSTSGSRRRSASASRKGEPIGLHDAHVSAHFSQGFIDGGLFTVDDTTSEIEIDVSGLIQDAYANDHQTLTFRISDPNDADTMVRFASKEHADQTKRPKLSVEAGGDFEPPNRMPTGEPIVVGAPLEGVSLSVDLSGVQDEDGRGALDSGNANYQWYRGATLVGSDATYTLDNGDVGHPLRVQVSYVDGRGFSEVLQSPPTSPIVNTNDPPSLLAANDSLGLVSNRLDLPLSGFGIALSDEDAPPQSYSMSVSLQGNQQAVVHDPQGDATGRSLTYSGERSNVIDWVNQLVLRPDGFAGLLELLVDVQDGDLADTLSLDINFYPDVFTVNSVEDTPDASPGDGAADGGGRIDRVQTTLRSALNEIQALYGQVVSSDPSWAPIIRFDDSLAGGTIGLTGGELTIATPLVVEGPGWDQLAIDAGGASRLLNVTSQAGVVEIEGLTLTGGGSETDGGAIFTSATSLDLNDLRITGNETVPVPAGDISYGGAVYVSESGGLEINSSELSHNVAHGSFSEAGAIWAGESGYTPSVSVVDSTISHNRAGGGGAIALRGDASLRLHNSTLSTNRATRDVGTGGIVSLGEAEATITQSTITANVGGGKIVDGAGVGGVAVVSGSVTMHNTIVADNRTAGGQPSDTSGAFVPISSHNLVGADANPSGLLTANKNKIGEANAGLLPLGGYGGRWQTHALSPTSPAVDAGDDSEDSQFAGPGDQRGFSRVVDYEEPELDGKAVDIGAFELSPTPIIAGDFNGDGFADDQIVLVTTTAGDPALRVQLDGGAAGSGVWAESIGAIDAATFRVGDFNGDGRDDLAYRDASDPRDWTFALSESSRFASHQATTDGITWDTQDLLVGDFDGDGADELIGRSSFNAYWGLLDGDDDAFSFNNHIGGSFGNDDFEGRILVGDANRDGRDDLIASSDGNGDWYVRLSDSTSDFPLAGAVNWGSWFDAHWSDETGTLIVDADGPLREVTEAYAEVYNNIELELTKGIRKGPQATRESGYGNAWDQAALLTDLLSADPAMAARYQPTVVVGTKQARVEDAAAWVGAKPTTNDQGQIVYLATDELLQLDDPAVYTGDLGVNWAIFEHAWAKVRLPAADGTLKLQDIDPSWKFKDYQAGIELPEDLDPTDAYSNGVFDEMRYLEETAKPTIDSTGVIVSPETPLEFFEGEVQRWLTETPEHTGKSVADVAYRGDLIDPVTTELRIGWGDRQLFDPAGSSPAVAYGSYDEIVSNANGNRDELTYQLFIGYQFGSDSGLWDDGLRWSYSTTKPDFGSDSYTVISERQDA